MATGRSDYPNQVNNVLGFPYIFRGALDVRATAITEEMKMAAARALAELAKEDVPESVSRGYGGERFRFGREYIIPKPFDPRVLLWVAPAVAKAAMDERRGPRPARHVRVPRAAQKRQSRVHGVMSLVHGKARTKLAKIVFPEGDAEKILHAAQILREEGLVRAHPARAGRQRSAPPSRSAGSTASRASTSSTPTRARTTTATCPASGSCARARA